MTSTSSTVRACQDCIYHQRMFRIRDRCTHPNCWLAVDTDYVTGERLVAYATCQEARRLTQLCGHEARFFVRKPEVPTTPTPQSWLEKLRGYWPWH
jgi:hypothetical protein